VLFTMCCVVVGAACGVRVVVCVVVAAADAAAVIDVVAVCLCLSVCC